MPLAIGTLVLAAFGGEELLDVSIPKLVPLVFFIFLDCYCLFNDGIKSEHANNRHTRGGGGGLEHVK